MRLCDVNESRPVVGSSKKIKDGSVSIWIPILTLLRSPPLKLGYFPSPPTRVCAQSANPNSMITLLTIFRFSLSLSVCGSRINPANNNVSYAVKFGNK
jgi:hypothetical protein